MQQRVLVVSGFVARWSRVPQALKPTVLRNSPAARRLSLGVRYVGGPNFYVNGIGSRSLQVLVVHKVSFCKCFKDV